MLFGPVAQRLEHVSYKDGVDGSNPSWPTLGPVAQLARAPALHAEGYRFKSGQVHQRGHLAQWLARVVDIDEVRGSNPLVPTRQEIASKGHSPRFAQRPNRKVFLAKKSVGDSAFWEKKNFKIILFL